jgi:hypothetical protein
VCLFVNMLYVYEVYIVSKDSLSTSRQARCKDMVVASQCRAFGAVMHVSNNSSRAAIVTPREYLLSVLLEAHLTSFIACICTD